MTDLGSLMDLYNQGVSYISQHKKEIVSAIGAAISLVIIPSYLLGYQIIVKPIKKRKQLAIRELQRLGVHEMLGIPTSEIKTPPIKAYLCDYIASGGAIGNLPLGLLDVPLDSRIRHYASQVESGSNPESVLTDALHDPDIRDFFIKGSIRIIMFPIGYKLKPIVNQT